MTKKGPVVLIADFIKQDLKPCPNFSTLNEIMNGFVLMINILIHAENEEEGRQSDTIKKRSIFAIKKYLETVPFKETRNSESWELLTKSLPLVKNVNRTQLTIINDEQFKRELEEYVDIMGRINHLVDKLAAKLIPPLYTKLVETHRDVKKMDTVFNTVSVMNQSECLLSVNVGEPCPKYAILNQILSCIELMVNILLYDSGQSFIAKDTSAIRQTILSPPYKDKTEWKAMSESLGQARNFLRHVPFSTITNDKEFEEKVILDNVNKVLNCIKKVLEYDGIMDQIDVLVAEADKDGILGNRHPDLFKKLFETHNLTQNLIKAELPKFTKKKQT